MARHSVHEIFKPNSAELSSFSSPPLPPSSFPSSNQTSPPLSHSPPLVNFSSLPSISSISSTPSSERWLQPHNPTSSTISPIRTNSYEPHTPPAAVTTSLLGQDDQRHQHHSPTSHPHSREIDYCSSEDEKKALSLIASITASTAVVGIPVATSAADSGTLLDTASAERRRQHSYGLSHLGGNTRRRTSRDMGISSLQVEQPVTSDSNPEGKSYWETESGSRVHWLKYIKRSLDLALVIWAVYNTIRYFLAYVVYASIQGQATALALGTISALSFAFFACAFILSLLGPQLIFHQIPGEHILLTRTAIYYIASLLLLTPAFVNIVLVGIWKGKGDVDPELAPNKRCGLEIDLVWSVTGHDSSSCSTKWGVWLTLAILRFLFTTVFLVAYFVIVRKYFCIRRNSVASSRTAFTSGVPAGRRRSKKHRYYRRPFRHFSKNPSMSSSTYDMSKTATPSSPPLFNRTSSGSVTATPSQVQSEGTVSLTPTTASPLVAAVLANANGAANSRYGTPTPQLQRLKPGHKSSDSTLASRTGSKKSVRASSSVHQVVAAPSDGSSLTSVGVGATPDAASAHQSVDLGIGLNEGHGGLVTKFKKIVDRIKGDSPATSPEPSLSLSSNPGASPNSAPLGVASVQGGGSSVSVLNVEELAKLRRAENPVGYGSGYSHPDALGQFARESGDSVQTSTGFGDGSAADREDDGEGGVGESRRTPTSHVDSAVSIRDNSVRHASREGEVRDDEVTDATDEEEHDDDDDRTEGGDEEGIYHDNYELDELDSDEMDQFYLAHQHSERLRLAQEQQQYYHQQYPYFDDYTTPYIPPALGYDEFGRPYRPEEPMRFLNGIIRRMPTIESMGSREVGSIAGSSLYQQSGYGFGTNGGNGSNGHGYGPSGLNNVTGPGGGAASVRSMNTNGSGGRPSGSSYYASDSGSRRSSWKAAVPAGGGSRPNSRPNSGGYQGGSQGLGQAGISQQATEYGELVVPDRGESDAPNSPASAASGMSGMSSGRRTSHGGGHSAHLSPSYGTSPTTATSMSTLSSPSPTSPSPTVTITSPSTLMTLSTMPSVTSMTRTPTSSSYHTALTSPLTSSSVTPLSGPNSSIGTENTVVPTIALVPRPPRQGADDSLVPPPGLS